MIEFLVQMPDLELRFQVHLVIIFRPQSVARLSTILAHHNDRRLHRSETGENQIKENKWIWVNAPVANTTPLITIQMNSTAPKLIRNFQLPPNSATWSESRSPNVSFLSNWLLMSLERISCCSRLWMTSWSSAESSPISSSKTSLT